MPAQAPSAALIPAPASSQRFCVRTVIEASAMAICMSVIDIARRSWGCSACSLRSLNAFDSSSRRFASFITSAFSAL